MVLEDLLVSTLRRRPGMVEDFLEDKFSPQSRISVMILLIWILEHSNWTFSGQCTTCTGFLQWLFRSPVADSVTTAMPLKRLVGV